MPLEYAKKHKYVPWDFAVMDEVDQYEEVDFGIEIFTAEEISKILTAVRSDALPALAIGAFAGIRTAAGADYRESGAVPEGGG